MPDNSFFPPINHIVDRWPQITTMNALLRCYVCLLFAPLAAVAFHPEISRNLPPQNSGGAYSYSRAERTPLLPTSRSKITSCYLWPFRMSGSSDNASGGGHYLIEAGTQLQLAADSVGSQQMACPHLLADAAEAIKEIGEYWSESWEAVTYAAEEASVAFYSLSNLQERTELAALYRGLSGELRQISAIVGCTSVGPPSAVPNLEGLAHYLKEAGQFVEKEGACKDSRAFGKALKRASKSLRALAKEY